MAHGGRRKGSGRPKGAQNRVTEEARAFARANLDVTLQALRHLSQSATSESVQLASPKEMLHTAIGRPRLSEEPPEPPVPVRNVYRWAMDESEATPDPARGRKNGQSK